MTKITSLPKGITLRHPLMLVLGLLWVSMAYTQESTTASGGDATGNGGSVAYSIGKIVYTTHTGSGGSMTQGSQYAYEIFTLGIKETVLDISLIAFPNPTTDKLTLKINDYNNEKLMYQLYDIQGKLINTGQIDRQQTQINMSQMPSAMYFLNVVTPQHQKVQSFKILKK